MAKATPKNTQQRPRKGDAHGRWDCGQTQAKTSQMGRAPSPLNTVGRPNPPFTTSPFSNADWLKSAHPTGSRVELESLPVELAQ